MNCLIDSNIVIFILRGNEKLKSELEQAIFDGRDVCISTITYYETKRKIVVLGNPLKQVAAFEIFIKTLKILSFTQQTADIASEIFAKLKSKGTPISSCDVLIGATAIEKDLLVISEDGHFDYIEGIKREKWNMF